MVPPNIVCYVQECVTASLGQALAELRYALATRAKGYTPSGAAFPIKGVNNIVAGNRKIPGTKYVIYQGPQYVNG